MLGISLHEKAFLSKYVDTAVFCVKICAMNEYDKRFNKLKKKNGEAVARLVRNAGLLELPNIASMLEFAGDNQDEIKLLLPIIEAKYNIPTNKKTRVDKSPFELLSEAGYDSFEVNTLEQQNSIRKYFRPNEELCTFNDPVRYKYNYMIHAVKYGVDKIKPAASPARQDEYGTSVISIQINKRTGYLSIKNRYNHSVSCADATFQNNPDNIIPGLAMSLSKYFNVHIDGKSMPEHFTMIDGNFMRYQYEIDGHLYGVNWYTERRGDVVKIDKNSELMFDCMVLNLKTGELRILHSFFWNSQEYLILKKLFANGKIQVQINKTNTKQRLLSIDGVHIATLEDCHIVELTLPGVEHIEDDFGDMFLGLREINLPDTETIGHSFFSKASSSDKLEIVNIPKARVLGDSFLFGCTRVKQLNARMVERVGGYFLWYNNILEILDMPELEYIGDDTYEFSKEIVAFDKSLKFINVPKLAKTMPEEYARLKVIVETNTPKTSIIMRKPLGKSH